MWLAFFLIVPSVIIVTIFLVHSVAERLRFKVKYSSLILCAVMALVVNFAAIELSTYLDKWHYVRLGVLVLIASIIVTLINQYLVKHEKSDVVIIDNIEEELALEEAAEDKMTVGNAKQETPILAANEDKAVDKIDKLNAESEEKNVSDPKTESQIKVPVKPLEKVDDKVNTGKSDDHKSADTKKSGKSEESPKALLVQETDTKSVAASDDGKTASSKPPITASTASKSEDKSISKDKSTKDKSFKSDDDKKTKVLDTPKDKLIPAEKPSKSKDEVKEYKTENKADDKLADINSHLDSLDDILDYAYAQRSKGDLNQAILAYQKALDRYRNDDYAPFIAIDLGNIYKEQAAYSKVIKTYEEALKLPSVMRNAENRREFNKNLTYMKIVQSVLLRHRALTMPFSKIPKQYLQEVETEFKSMQMNTSSSRRNF